MERTLKKITLVLLIIDFILGIFIIRLAGLEAKVLILILSISIIGPPIGILFLKLQWQFFTYINKAELFPINALKLIFSYSLFMLFIFSLYYFKQDKNLAIVSLIFVGHPIYFFYMVLRLQGKEV